MLFISCVNTAAQTGMKVYSDQRSEFTSSGITFHLVDASDPCEERNLPREVVKTLFEEIECCYWLIQALIHLSKEENF